jgi:2,5-diketo-D-gluconate reductase A
MAVNLFLGLWSCRWGLAHGLAIIPKSVTPARIRENFEVLGFELPPADVEALDGLEKGRKLFWDPEEVA